VYLALIVVVLLVGENTWHRLSPGWRRDMVMAALLSLIIMHALQIMNDLAETVKAGSLFFLCTAIIVNMSLYVSSKDQKESETLPPEEPAP
jgi:O-antigen ligase